MSTASYSSCNRFLKRFIFERLSRSPVDGNTPVWQVTGAGVSRLGLPIRGQRMIKSELVARLAERYPHLYHRDVERIVSTILDEVSKALAQGHRVELRGFGA